MADAEQGRSQKLFTSAEFAELRRLLVAKALAGRSEQKQLREQIRAQFKVYIGEFESAGSAFTAPDLDLLVARGEIMTLGGRSRRLWRTLRSVTIEL